MADEKKVLLQKVSDDTLALFERCALSPEDVMANLKADYAPEAIDAAMGKLSFDWIQGKAED
jgi:hypothetical protein